MREFNKTTVEAILATVKELNASVEDMRQVKDELNVIIKGIVTEKETIAKEIKEKAEAAANEEGLAFIKDKKAGERISVKVGEGVGILEIKTINLDKGTVSGYVLDAEGNKTLNKDGRVKTMWRHYKDIVVIK